MNTKTHTRDSMVHFSSRLPERLLDQLAGLAERNDRSVGGEIRQALKAHVEREHKRGRNNG